MDRMAGMYAMHVWRERIDIWEATPSFMVYDQFVSVYELERYFVNPWLRASAWIQSSAVSLVDLPPMEKFDLYGMTGPSLTKTKRTRAEQTAVKFQFCVNQIPMWWANQKGSNRFGPIPELALSTSGFVSAAQLLDPDSKVKREKLVEGYWHNAVNDRPVEILRRDCFSWQEFIVRRDEMAQMLPMVLGILNSMGPRGASMGDGIAKATGRKIHHSWSNERKLINRLIKRLSTAQRYADAIAEVALTQFDPR
jgi:hypothetical protein